jgi:hypothetical protein
VAAGPVVALDKGASHPHVFRICAKAMLHGTLGREVARERERAEALKKLVRDLPGDEVRRRQEGSEKLPQWDKNQVRQDRNLGMSD